MTAPTDDSVPVLIVGGGPTGLVLSALLSRFGVDSLLVERDPTTCDHPQAHVVNTRSMEILRLLGIAGAVREAALPPAAASHVRWVTSLAGEELAALDLAPDPEAIARHIAASPEPPASCGQDRIEPLLAELAAKERGAVEFSTEMVELEAGPAGVRATLSAGGRERVVEARFAVGCDGASSRTRRRMGIPMEGPEALAHVVGIYFHADLSALVAERPSVLFWTIDVEAPGTFIAIDGRERWVFHAAWDAERQAIETFTPERCIEVVRRAIGRDVPIDVRSVRPWTMSAQVAERYREGPVLLAGDAAHRFPPTGGFGMNTGIQDAHNLAWKLAAVFQGFAPESLLDSYEAERLPVGRDNRDWSARNAMGLAEVIGPGAAHQGRRLAEGEVDVATLSAEIQAIADREIGHFSALGRDLGFQYETGALIPDGSSRPAADDPDRDYVPTARPGARAPHLGAVRGDSLLSTLDLFDGQFTLLAPAEGALAWRAAAASLDGGIPFEVVGIGLDVGDPSGTWASSYGIETGAALVRPDGHVAWRTKQPVADAAATLRDVLGRVLAGRSGEQEATSARRTP